MMDRWRQRLQHFMIGRYGVDQLARFLSGCILVLLLLDLVLRTHILYWIALALLFYSYFHLCVRRDLSDALPRNGTQSSKNAVEPH